MKNLFKYASEHWKALLAIVAILIVQAYCDLSLPAYTSDIVNVGIQQGGVEDHIPDAISAEDMETLLLFTSEKDGKTVLSAYEKDDKTYEEQAYVLKDSVKEAKKGIDFSHIWSYTNLRVKEQGFKTCKKSNMRL